MRFSSLPQLFLQEREGGLVHIKLTATLLEETSIKLHRLADEVAPAGVSVQRVEGVDLRHLAGRHQNPHPFFFLLTHCDTSFKSIGDGPEIPAIRAFSACWTAQTVYASSHTATSLATSNPAIPSPAPRCGAV